MKWVRRLYDWVLHWAETPYGSLALFLLAFAESSFFPIPPDALLIALAISVPTKAFRFAAICSVGSLLGGIGGYAIGSALWNETRISEYFFRWVPGFTPEVFEKVKEQYHQYGFWVVFAAGFTPIPYKVITITAGVVKLNFPIFVVASAVGRAGRFFLVGLLIRLFGKKIRAFIDRYFNILSIIFVLLLLAGFVAIKYFTRH